MIASMAGYGQKNSLVLKLKKDSTYYINNTANMTIVENIQGQEQVVIMTVGGRVSHKVVSIKDTIYELAVSYEQLNMKFDIAGNIVINVNSSLGHDDLISKMVNNMLHRPMTVLISKKGKVLAIKKSDTIYAHMFDDMPQVPADKKAQLKAQMEKSFGDKALKTNFQDAFAVLPAREVGLNDSWNFTTQMETVVKANIKTTYVLKELAPKAYIIHGQSTIGSIGDGSYAEMNGMPVRLNDAHGDYTVDVKIDRESGWIMESKITKNITGTMQIKDSEKVPGGLSFPITITGDITMNDK